MASLFKSKIQDPLEDSLLEGHPLECSICLDRMTEISFLYTQPDEHGNICTHYFCSSCIEPMVWRAKEQKRDPICPSCRRVIIAVSKSRAANELLKEVEQQREQRKKALGLADKLSIDLSAQIKEKIRLEEELQRHKKQHIEEVEKQMEELRNANEQIEKLRQELENEKELRKQEVMQISNKRDTELRAMSTRIAEVTSLVEECQSQLASEKSKLHDSNRKLQDVQNRLMEEAKTSALLKEKIKNLEKEVAEKTAEEEKWHKMYLRAVEELNRVKNMRRAPDTPDSKPMSSWISPSFSKLSSSLTSLTTYWTARSGILVKDSTEYKFLERRGSSRQPTVWKGVMKQGEKVVKTIALKRISETPQSVGAAAFREAMLLHKLEHRNILKLEGVLRDVTVPGVNTAGDFLILPFVEFDLEYLLSDQISFKIKAPQIRIIMYQLLSALYYLHSAELVHRDIKPTSVLLDSDCNVKLGSLNTARSLYSQPFNKVPMSRYSPPENAYLSETTTKPANYWKAADIWSLGCVFAEMLRGKPLFDSRDKTVLLSQICTVTECRPTNADMSRFPLLNSIQIPTKDFSLEEHLKPQVIYGSPTSSPTSSLTSSDGSEVPPETVDIVKNMLLFDPGRRITAYDALQHKYFVGSNLVDVHRTCPLGSELTDAELPQFAAQYCGGL